MEPVVVTTDDLINVSLGGIPLSEGTTFVDVIIDWIVERTRNVIDVVTDYVRRFWSSIQNTVTSWTTWLWDNIKSLLTSLSDWVRSARDWIESTYALLKQWVDNAWTTVTSAVSSAIGQVQTWVFSARDTITSWVTRSFNDVLSFVNTSLTNLSSSISAWFSEMDRGFKSFYTTIVDKVAKLGTDIAGDLRTFQIQLSGQLTSSFDWLATFLQENIVTPMELWWDQFIARVLDFGAWADKLLDAIADWFTVDIPGSSPRWTGIFDSIGDWFISWFGRPFQRLVENFPKEMARELQIGLGWIGDIFNSIFETFNDAITSFARQIGPMSPDMAMSNYSSIVKVGLAGLGGLAGMTVAGEFLNPLSHLGLGHISAMVYDMTNYKLITGAFMGAMTFSMLQTPLRYYFNNLFRPRLLTERDFTELMSRRAFIDPEALQNPPLVESVRALTGGDGLSFERRLIGYFGFPDVYHGLYRELANTRLGYFPLAGIARTGFYTKTWFTEALHRSGYSETSVKALLIMYEKMVDEAVQGSMSGAAIRRFKEGYTDESRFTSEMAMLGYSDKQIIKYLAAAKLDYATDFISDLIAAYKDAVRKGNLSLDEYRDKLLELGIVPERVWGYVLRERARIRPKEALTVVGPATPFFETDQGKIELDTIRRQRRKALIGRDQEMAALVTLGMEPGYAEAIVDNDDVRLAEKGGEE